MYRLLGRSIRIDIVKILEKRFKSFGSERMTYFVHRLCVLVAISSYPDLLTYCDTECKRYVVIRIRLNGSASYYIIIQN